MTRDWIKIDPGLGMEDIEDDDDGFDLQILASRTYGFKGKPFPRISITIHPDLGVFSGNKDITGVRVGLDKNRTKKLGGNLYMTDCLWSLFQS